MIRMQRMFKVIMIFGGYRGILVALMESSPSVTTQKNFKNLKSLKNPSVHLNLNLTFDEGSRKSMNVLRGPVL